MEEKIAKQKLNVIVLVDCSKSMQGERIAQVNNALRDIRTHLLELQGEKAAIRSHYISYCAFDNFSKKMILH